MSFLFNRSRGKGPGELVKSTVDALHVLERKRGDPKAVDEVTKGLVGMKVLLYGDAEGDPSPELATVLVTEVLQTDFVPLMVGHLGEFEFEPKKDMTQIFNNMLRRQVGGRLVVVEYLSKNLAIMDALVNGYDSTAFGLNCGSMLRECIRHQELAKYILYSPLFVKFFEFVQNSNFDVASDAFVTFKDLLTKHKSLCAEFLEKNYDAVFEQYTKLLTSDNYVTRRQSLKLLGELLLDRANFNIMTKYICNQANLKLMMNLLRDPSKSIQFEAFHVFKVFVANPNKPKAIMDILVKNKEKLVSFLSQFHNEKDDEQFIEEKQLLIKEIGKA